MDRNLDRVRAQTEDVRDLARFQVRPVAKREHLTRPLVETSGRARCSRFATAQI